MKRTLRKEGLPVTDWLLDRHESATLTLAPVIFGSDRKANNSNPLTSNGETYLNWPISGGIGLFYCLAVGFRGIQGLEHPLYGVVRKWCCCRPLFVDIIVFYSKPIMAIDHYPLGIYNQK